LSYVSDIQKQEDFPPFSLSKKEPQKRTAFLAQTPK